MGDDEHNDPLTKLLDGIVSEADDEKAERERAKAERERAKAELQAKVAAAGPAINAILREAQAGIGDIHEKLSKAGYSCHIVERAANDGPQRHPNDDSVTIDTYVMVIITHPRRTIDVEPPTSGILVHKAIPVWNPALEPKVLLEVRWGGFWSRKSYHYIDIRLRDADDPRLVRAKLRDALTIILNQS